VSDRDYNRYMDIQQAINLAAYERLQKESIAPLRSVPAEKPNALAEQRGIRAPVKLP